VIDSLKVNLISVDLGIWNALTASGVRPKVCPHAKSVAVGIGRQAEMPEFALGGVFAWAFVHTSSHPKMERRH